MYIVLICIVVYVDKLEGGIVVTRATVMGEPALPRARAVNIFISGKAWQLELRGWSSSVCLSLGARINIFKLI
jgi:hypothetical protein